MKITIGAYQMEIVPNDLKKNLKKIEYAAKISVRRKCNFLLLPENCWSGPYYQEKYRNEVADFVSYQGAQLSKKNNMYIIAGTCMEVRKELGAEQKSVSCIFSPKGTVLGYSVKESDKDPKIFDTEFGKIGVQIGSDLYSPAITEYMAQEGAIIVFSPAFWSKTSKKYDAKLAKKFGFVSEAEILRNVVPARSLENNIFFVFTNGAGTYKTKEVKETLLGFTQICQPLKGPIEVYRNNRENLMIQKIDTEILKLSNN